MKLFFSGKHDELHTQLRILTCRRRQRWDRGPVPAPTAREGLQAAGGLSAFPAKPPASHEPLGKRERLLCCSQSPQTIPVRDVQRHMVTPGGSACAGLSLQNELT